MASEMKKIYFLLLALLLASCNSPASSTQAEPVNIQYTFSAQTWLADSETCAGENIISPERRSVDTFDFSNMGLAIRIGDLNVTTPAYQIDTEDIVVIVNPQNPVASLTEDKVTALFTGSIDNWQSVNGTDAPVQVWAFSADEDVQQVFEQTALGGAPVTSLARLAAGPDEMAQAVANDVNAIGILTRHWVAGNVSAVYTAASVPVLALTGSEPSAAVQEIVVCLQK